MPKDRNKIIVIGSTQTKIKGMVIEDFEYLDKQHGYEIINTHYLIKEDGEIIQTLDLDKKCGFNSTEENNHIFIRYVGGINENNEIIDNRTKKQKYSLYALLYTLHKMGYDNIIDEEEFNGKHTAGFDVKKETRNINWLWEKNDISVESFRKLRDEIKNFDQMAWKLIDSGKFKTKSDIENSKYAKIYNLGIKKFNDILDTHFNKVEELIEVGGEYGELEGQEVLISKVLFDSIKEKCKARNLDADIFFFTMLQENMCLYFYKKEWYRKIGKKKYTHPICIFHAWSVIKKSFPVSKTTRVLKDYQYKTNLNDVELHRLLLAYILLYEETKTIHDFDYKTLWETLYEKMEYGDYVCGLNYVQGEHQINYRNVRLYLLKDWTAKYKKII
jgi:hypothetical protein